MKTSIALITALLITGLSTAQASNVGVDLNLHLGNTPQPPPARVVVREPAPTAIYIEDDVDFVYPSKLGFYVGVGLQDDLFFLNNFYFTYRNGSWYKSHNHRSGWMQVERKHLPPGLRKHNIERIRYYRDREYAVYERDRDHYHGRHTRSERGEWKGYRKSDKDYRKSEKRREKDERKEDKYSDKEDRGHGHGHEQGGHGGR